MPCAAAPAVVCVRDPSFPLSLGASAACRTEKGACLLAYTHALARLACSVQWYVPRSQLPAGKRVLVEEGVEKKDALVWGVVWCGVRAGTCAWG